MHPLKALQNRIRGWFPSIPTVPQQQKNEIGKIGFTKTSANPLPKLLENKYQRNGGIVIGLGLGLLMIGSLGALVSYQTYGEVARVLGTVGIAADNYALRHMLDLTAVYLTIMMGGVFGVGFGALALRSRLFREIEADKDKRPHYRLGSALIGGGGALTLLSFRNLFSYLLAIHDPSIINLQLFGVFFAVGVSLFTSGLLSWRRKK
jgi:hypothetical protein